MKKFILFSIMIISVALPTIVLPVEKQHLYSTWDTMEMDRIASLWVIKRFVDLKATFKFYPKGTTEMEGMQIDTPLSKIKRTHSASAYENLIISYNLNDPILLYIAQLVRDVEINIWGKKGLPESQGIDLILKGVILESGGNPSKCIEKGFLVFDALYRALEAKR